jgi:methylmalonyl-CoA mutase N-terminal domain/subunit
MKIDEFAPPFFWAIGMNHFMEIAKMGRESAFLKLFNPI